MSELLTMQDLANGHLDVKALGEAANGDENTIVTTRTGNTYPSAERAINIMFQNGGLPAKAFPTIAVMETDGVSLADGDLAMIYNETANNGLYVKTAGAWVKSEYDTATIVRDIADMLVDRGENLYDATKVTKGKAIGAFGTIENQTSYAISDYIKVEANTPYTISGGDGVYQPFIHTSWYGENKDFIKRVATSLGEDGKLTMQFPSVVKYVRFNINGGVPDGLNRMFNKGSVALPYEPFYIKLGEEIQVPDSYKRINSYLKLSANLFDPNKAIPGVIITSNGHEASGDGMSDFIAVKPSTVYTAARSIDARPTNLLPFVSVAYYKDNKAFIRREDMVLDETIGNIARFTTPADAAYVVLNYNGGTAFEHERMLTEGAAVLAYRDSDPELTGITLNHLDINNVKPPKYNLLDATKATLGIVLNSAGNVIENPLYSMSDFIKVTPGGKYSISGGTERPFDSIKPFVDIYYYDADKVFINRGYLTDIPPFVTTMPATAEYVRLSMNNGFPYDQDRMFVKGEAIPPYDPPFPQVDDVVLSQVGVNELYKQLPINLGNQYLTDIRTDGVLDIGAADWGEQYRDFKTRTAQQVYDMWDSLLVDYPEYITKEIVGADASGTPLPLFRYKQPEPQSNTPRKLPKIFVTCSLHGLEKVPPLAMYLLIKQMIDNWQVNEGLEALSSNFELLVMPLCNPSGWDDNTRKNRNGVDLNRNFEPGRGFSSDDPTSVTYHGPYAYSELETQAILSVFDAHPDLDAFYDFHNFGGKVQGFEPYIWIPCGNIRTTELAQLHVSRMTRKFRRDYSWFPSPTWFCGYVELHRNAGMVTNYANSIGIPYTATYECCEIWHKQAGAVMFDDMHCKTAVESVGNWLLMNINTIAHKPTKTP